MILSGIPYHPSAQTACSGVWGKPLVNVDFGSGPNPGPALAAATSVYTYTDQDCPPDGFYTVRNASEGCYYNDWHTVKTDHTGNKDGYFLLINTSFLPNNFYLDTVRHLCSSTTYRFAAWILNMVKPSTCPTGGVQPNINFRVEKMDGTILENFNTNDIPATDEPVWNQYAFTFSTTETNIVLRMTNVNPGGCGGDFAIDDITLSPCVADVNINLHNTNNVPQTIVYHCKRTDTAFTFNSHFKNIYSDVGYVWESSVDSGSSWQAIPGANTSTYKQIFLSNPKEALYLYRLKIGEKENLNEPKCLVQASSDSVLTISEPVPVIVSNSPLCEGADIRISAEGGKDYVWNGPDGYLSSMQNIVRPNASVINSGYYRTKVIADNGCFSIDSVKVVVNISPKAFAGADTSICTTSSIQLNGSGGTGYHWTPSAGLSDSSVSNPIASPVQTTVYSLQVTNEYNCTDTTAVHVNILKKIVADAGNDQKIFRGNTAQLTGTISGSGFHYYWTPALQTYDAYQLQTQVRPRETTVYTLHADSDYGCGNSADDVIITVAYAPSIPNAFTPNNDGINDTWQIPDLADYTTIDVMVFNRYGQKVFMSSGYYKPWDGKYNGHELPIGTYYYIIDLKNSESPFQGAITLLK